MLKEKKELKNSEPGEEKQGVRELSDEELEQVTGGGQMTGGEVVMGGGVDFHVDNGSQNKEINIYKGGIRHFEPKL